MPDTAELERTLRAVGLRVTRPRVAVLDAVHTHPHVDTEALSGAARADGAGFDVDDAEVIFWGRRPACTAA